MKAVWMGALLSLGAPAGYLLFSFALLNREQLGLLAWAGFVLSHQRALMVYLTVPTLVAFSVFGYYHGRQEAQLAFKTEQMEHFLHIAAHDIRSPLAAIQEAASLLKDKIPGEINQDQQNMIQTILRQIAVVRELTDELLDIHKMEAGYTKLLKERAEVIPLLERSVEEMGLLVRQKSATVTIKSDLTEKNELELDLFRMRQVFRNIIQNAIRYVPEGGTIAVRVFRNGAGEIEITISNNGPHIPEEKLTKIFDKFEQAEDRDQRLGAGLGLSIAKRIVELHGGKISAENVNPTGVRFRIQIPPV